MPELYSVQKENTSIEWNPGFCKTLSVLAKLLRQSIPYNICDIIAYRSA